ncbi:MAG: hypothetical protein NT079_01760, partial [Candidatus Omnitrophica bacterium]|nr:hypothetical protein [Candidatus Omnitrophota bacterium]
MILFQKNTRKTASIRRLKHLAEIETSQFLPKLTLGKIRTASKLIHFFIILCFLTNLILPASGFAQSLNLPALGAMISLSPSYQPALLTGIQIYPENPLQFDFIVNSGDDHLKGDALKSEAEKMIKYFLASLTIPKKDLWVNLSPYEKDRIAPDALARTDIGRDLLAQDYLLKQITASLIYPEGEIGKKFWERIYKKAYETYGTTQVPVDTFNKVWIMPDKAAVYQHGNMVFVAESSLKVMLEEDYLAQKESIELSAISDKQRQQSKAYSLQPTADHNSSNPSSAFASQIVREIVIPELQKEINTGKNFATLRQVYNSLILATWFKKSLRESLLGHVYVDQSKVKGIELDTGVKGQRIKGFKENLTNSTTSNPQILKSSDPLTVDEIYNQYLAAFQKGAYNYIKVEYDPYAQKAIPRKYFSGGFTSSDLEVPLIVEPTPAQERTMIRSDDNARFAVALRTSQGGNSLVSSNQLQGPINAELAVDALTMILEQYKNRIKRVDVTYSDGKHDIENNSSCNLAGNNFRAEIPSLAMFKEERLPILEFTLYAEGGHTIKATRESNNSNVWNIEEGEDPLFGYAVVKAESLIGAVKEIVNQYGKRPILYVKYSDDSEEKLPAYNFKEIESKLSGKGAKEIREIKFDYYFGHILFAPTPQTPGSWDARVRWGKDEFTSGMIVKADAAAELAGRILRAFPVLLPGERREKEFCKFVRSIRYSGKKAVYSAGPFGPRSSLSLGVNDAVAVLKEDGKKGDKIQRFEIFYDLDENARVIAERISGSDQWTIDVQWGSPYVPPVPDMWKEGDRDISTPLYFEGGDAGNIRILRDPFKETLEAKTALEVIRKFHKKFNFYKKRYTYLLKTTIDEKKFRVNNPSPVGVEIFLSEKQKDAKGKDIKSNKEIMSMEASIKVSVGAKDFLIIFTRTEPGSHTWKIEEKKGSSLMMSSIIKARTLNDLVQIIKEDYGSHYDSKMYIESFAGKTADALDSAVAKEQVKKIEFNYKAESRKILAERSREDADGWTVSVVYQNKTLADMLETFKKDYGGDYLIAEVESRSDHRVVVKKEDMNVIFKNGQNITKITFSYAEGVVVLRPLDKDNKSWKVSDERPRIAKIPQGDTGSVSIKIPFLGARLASDDVIFQINQALGLEARNVYATLNVPHANHYDLVEYNKVEPGLKHYIGRVDMTYANGWKVSVSKDVFGKSWKISNFIDEKGNPVKFEQATSSIIKAKTLDDLVQIIKADYGFTYDSKMYIESFAGKTADALDSAVAKEQVKKIEFNYKAE